MRHKKWLPLRPLSSSATLAALLLLLLATAPLAFPVRAQDAPPPEAGIAAGEQVPDVLLSNMRNYPSETARLSDFRGKLVILDFWATWCGSCLVSMPKMEKLQQTFGDSIQVLAVTTQGPDIVDPFRAKNPVLRRVTFPLVLGNENLKALFPHRSIPHLVWIAPDGTLLSQTGTFDANPETVRSLLRGARGNFKDPKKDNLTYDALKPLFLDGNGGSPFPLHRSILTSYASGLGNRGGFVKTDSTVRLFQVNAPMARLFLAASGLPGYFPIKQVLLESDAARQYQVQDQVLEKEQKYFCYELLLPIEKLEQAHALMRQDLQQMFGLQAKVEKKKIACWVLTRKKGTPPPLSQGGEAVNNFTDYGNPAKYMQNEPIGKLVSYLDKAIPRLPVLDKTGITQPVDLRLEGDLQDIGQLNGQLAAYGLQLEQKKLSLEVLSIR